MTMECFVVFFFQAEDGIRDAQESRGLGDVYKRQVPILHKYVNISSQASVSFNASGLSSPNAFADCSVNLLTSSV